MAKITSKSELNVGTELLIDEANREYELVEAGNLIAKDGVSLYALYSKFIDLWLTPQYQDSPFPMSAVDVLSGQYAFGKTDAGDFSDWKPKNQATRDMHRDGGWSEYNASGDLLQEFAGFTGLGTVKEGSQLYYVLEEGDTPINFPFTDQFNVGVKIYGDAAHGNFDKRSSTTTKVFARVQGEKYFSSTPSDTDSVLGANKVSFLIRTEVDGKITDDDSEMGNAPYNNIDIEYFGSNQQYDVGGSDYPFTEKVSGNLARLEEIYTKHQFLLRQDSDIDEGTGTVIGKTADSLMYFDGNTLVTTAYIENIHPDDINRVRLVDANGVTRTYPYVASGNLNFNPPLVGANSSYRMYYELTPNGSAYGDNDAITVQDSNGDDVAGEITAGSLPLSYDIDGNTQDGYTGGEARNVVLVGVRAGSAKYTVTRGTITRSKGLVFSLVAGQDPSYRS